MEEEEEDNEDDPDEETNQNAQISTVENLNDDNDKDEKLLESFGKDQLINLLHEATDVHRDFADKIRQVADQDSVRRKVFVHGLGWDTNAEALMNAFKPYGEIEVYWSGFTVRC